ncbi:MAG: hypothetical protein JSV60_05570, partial [Desulfobacterales bacterium]
GVCVLSSPARLDRKLSSTPEIMERLLKVMRSMFDFVIVDGGQSLDSTALKILQMADRVIVVSILSVPCLSNTNKLLRSFDDLGYPPRQKIHVIINRYLRDADISMEDAETAIDHKIFQRIVNDYRATISAINKGQALVRLEPKAAISKDFKELASTFLQAGTTSQKETKREDRKKGAKWWQLRK